MRRLAQPQVLKSAALAALLTVWLCLPRLWLWPHRPYPLWYLGIILFLGATLLWGFVFAWHSHYTQRPVFHFKIEPRLWALTAAAAMGVATLLHLFLDPALRLTTPEDFPVNVNQWLAMTLFHLAFIQLFLIFAPFAWLVRLVHNRALAIALTVLVGVVIMVLKTQSSVMPLPSSLFAKLFVFRVLLGWLTVSLYLRGGVLLVWWWGFLLEARHLLSFLSV